MEKCFSPTVTILISSLGIVMFGEIIPQAICCGLYFIYFRTLVNGNCDLFNTTCKILHKFFLYYSKAFINLFGLVIWGFS